MQSLKSIGKSSFGAAQAKAGGDRGSSLARSGIQAILGSNLAGKTNEVTLARAPLIKILLYLFSAETKKDGIAGTDGLADPMDDLHPKGHSFFQAPPVAVLPAVAEGGHEFPDEIPVGSVELDSVIAGGLGAQGHGDRLLDQVFDFSAAQFSGWTRRIGWESGREPPTELPWRTSGFGLRGRVGAGSWPHGHERPRPVPYADDVEVILDGQGLGAGHPAGRVHPGDFYDDRTHPLLWPSPHSNRSATGRHPRFHWPNGSPSGP